MIAVKKIIKKAVNKCFYIIYPMLLYILSLYYKIANPHEIVIKMAG